MSDIVSFNSNWLQYNGNVVGSVVDYNPLRLPPNTLRLRFRDGTTPYIGEYTSATWTQVSSSPNIWDVYQGTQYWGGMVQEQHDLIEVLGGNTTGIVDMAGLFRLSENLVSVELFDTRNVTNMTYMFSGCDSLSAIPQFPTHSVTNMERMLSGLDSLATIPTLDTANVTNMIGMFEASPGLRYIPLLDTSSVTTCHDMFAGCFNVESGALALFNQMANQATPPATHYRCFENCGRDTVTGAQELAQIPSDWK